jgi:hypothetical protein
MISRLRYTFREMWASLSRNLTLTAAAVITSTISLLLFGLTLLIQQAFSNQLSTWSGGVEMIVYLDHGSNQDQIDLVYAELTRARPRSSSPSSTAMKRAPTQTHSGCSQATPPRWSSSPRRTSRRRSR